MLSVSGPLAGAEGDLGWGCLLQKSNAFIKKTINWYQKKLQGGLQEEAEKEAGRQQGPTPWKTAGGAVQGSWDADTKCMSASPKPSGRRWAGALLAGSLPLESMGKALYPPKLVKGPWGRDRSSRRRDCFKVLLSLLPAPDVLEVSQIWKQGSQLSISINPLGLP